MSPSLRVCGLMAVACLSSNGLSEAAPKPKDKDVDAAWAVAGAPYRVCLHEAAPPDMPEAGWAIEVPDFGSGKPDMSDVMLLDPDGKEIALDPVWRGTGRSLLVLAQSMPAEHAAATLYFGGNASRRLRSWSAKRSLLLETRRLPAGAGVATFAAWQAAWKKAGPSEGAGFVSQIFHGDNPFGESHHFLSRYTGQLKTGDGGSQRFYTLSDDVSYVMIDGKAAVQWQQLQPPPLYPKKVPTSTVRVPKGFAGVEYCHAAVQAPAAMVLGWEQSGKLGNVPPEAWVHPGTVTSESFESLDGAPVPVASLEATRYLGFADHWYVMIKGEITKPSDDWQVEWLWPDGRIDQGHSVKRLWMSLEPLRINLRLRKGLRVIEGWRVLVIPHDMEAASIEREKQLEVFTGLLENENPATLPEPARRAGFALARAFLPAATAARWAEAWLAVAKPSAGLWVTAMAVAIRETAKRDPQAALDRLTALPAPARAAMADQADMLELDLRVFGLKDPLVIGLVAKLRKSSDKAVANMAAIRLGDYHLLNNRIEDATRCFNEAVSHGDETVRKAPVIDRSHSLAIEDLVQDKHLDEARVKLESWERQRPAAKIEGDQLFWRARVMFLAGEWNRALQDLTTSLKVRPGAPEEIDVLFWQARALYELGSKNEARKIWNALVKDYPKHERAEEAKQWTAKP